MKIMHWKLLMLLENAVRYKTASVARRQCLCPMKIDEDAYRKTENKLFITVKPKTQYN